MMAVLYPKAPTLMPLDVSPRRLEARGSALADEVYALLSQAILDGRLAAGERVRDIELAHDLGMSRTPVREALQRLERQGLIEVSAHRYTRVTAMDASITAETVEYIGYLSGILVQLAMRRADDAEHAAMLSILDDMVAAAEQGSSAAVYGASARFYAAATRASGNRLFIRVLRESAITVERFLAGWQPLAADPSGRVDSFVRLRRAVADRDGAAAEQIIREQHELLS